MARLLCVSGLFEKLRPYVGPQGRKDNRDCRGRIVHQLATIVAATLKNGRALPLVDRYRAMPQIRLSLQELNG
jgi:hypothetical protein